MQLPLALLDAKLSTKVNDYMPVKRILSILLTAVILIGSFAALPTAATAAQSSFVPTFRDIEVIDGGVRFTWEPYINSSYPDGVFYRIYYKNASGDWVRMTTTASTRFVDLDIHIGHSYTYTIRCVSPDESEFASDFNATGWTVTYYDAPSVSADVGRGATTDDGMNQVKQTPAITADDGPDDTVNDTTDVQETFDNAKEELPISSKGDSDLAPTAADTPTIKQDTLSWTGDAPAYRVYRKRMDSDELEVICDSTDESSFTYEYAQDDSVYAYKVCALDRYGEVASACGVTPYFTEGELYCTRNRWIYELLCTEYDDVAEHDFSDYTYEELSDLAHEYGALTPMGYFNDGTSLNRRFTADTLINLYQYEPHALGNTYNIPGNNTESFIKWNRDLYYAADTSYSNINTVAYYGWFDPDYRNQLHLFDEVNADEWDHLMEDLSLYRTWHGKTVISFGDSGMQGRGNIVKANGASFESSWRDINRNDFVNKRFPRLNEEMMEGPVEIIGEKYGMNHRDYSWSGSSMGTELEESGSYYIFTNSASYKCHIANQVRTAIKENQKADLIILNGGDNDVYYPSIPYSAATPSRYVYDWGYSAPEWFSTPYHRDFHYAHPEYFHYNDSKVIEDYSNETSFVGGAEMTFDLIKKNYSSVPVIYIRSHQIDYDSLEYQRVFQEKMLSIAAENGARTIDLFNISDLDGFNKRMVAKFCYDGYWSDGSVDDSGVHPNGRGYSMHYLPHIEKVMGEL